MRLLPALFALLVLASPAVAFAPQVLPLDSIVMIGVPLNDGSGKMRLCSGVIVDDVKNHIVTNAHCTMDLSEYRIKLRDGSFHDAHLVRESKDLEKLDIAVLSIDPSVELKAIEIGNSDKPLTDTPVWAIGHPRQVEWAVTVGKVLEADGDDIRHSTHIDVGSSGGALVDIKGRLIGINEATTTIELFGQVMRWSHAIPINKVMKFVRQR